MHNKYVLAYSTGRFSRNHCRPRIKARDGRWLRRFQWFRSFPKRNRNHGGFSGDISRRKGGAVGSFIWLGVGVLGGIRNILGNYLYFHFTGFVLSSLSSSASASSRNIDHFFYYPPATTKATKLPNIPVADIPQSKI